MGIFRPHTEGTETRRSLGHRGELALAGRTQGQRRRGGEEGGGRGVGEKQYQPTLVWP